MSNTVKYVGNSKKEIYDAYKEIKARLALSEEASPISTTTAANAQAIESSINNASKLDVNAISNSLSTLVTKLEAGVNEYNDITTAIDAKKKELKEILAIEVSANDLLALAAAKDKIIAEKDEQAKNIIANAREIAIVSEEQTDTYHEDKLAELAAIISESDKTRKRDEEEYDYNTNRKRIQEENKLEDKLSIKAKSLDAKEVDLKFREAFINDKDKEIENLTTNIKEMSEKVESKLDEAFKSGVEKGRKSANIAAAISKSGLDADNKIAEAKIIGLEDKIVNLIKQLDSANHRVDIGNNKLAEMASSALNANADAATITKVGEMVASGKNK